MSSIDERIVEMQFDNAQFEKGAKESINTLKNLKNALKLEDAGSGLKNLSSGFKSVQDAAKNVDVSIIGKGVEALHGKFSALEVMAVSALNRITNSAIDTGKRLVNSLSLDQIRAGWSKYEEKTASVQTIMNATGKSIDDVNGYLNKLMWFSDETSYGFTDMTAALAQLTSTGGDIDTLIPMITGIANATAYAGKGASEFSRAIYNISQSYGSGHLQLMDWKSLEGAGVASKELKQTLIDTAVAMGKLEEGEVTVATFSETLKDKWADTEVMEAAFGKFSQLSEEAYKLVESGQYDLASEAIAALSGKYDEVAEKAFKSAQEAKSFTEAIDATKDAVSSGWMKSFELIFGNYEQAKVMWTDLANTLWDVFASSGETRNEMLEEVMTSNSDKFTKELFAAGITTDRFDEALESVLEKNGRLKQMLPKIKKEFGSYTEAIRQGAIPTKYLSLTLDELGKSTSDIDDLKAGLKFGDTNDDVKKVQKTLEGLGYELTQFGVDGKYGKETQSAIEAFQRANKLEVTGFVDDATLSKMKELAITSTEIGKNLYELAEGFTELGGRELILETISNAWSGLSTVVGAVKGAFSDIFPPITSHRIFDMITRIKELSENLVVSEETAEKIKSVFSGVFSVFHAGGSIISDIASSILSFLSPITNRIPKIANGFVDALSVVGDFLTKFSAKVESANIVGKTFEFIQNGIASLGELGQSALGRLTNKYPKFFNALTASADLTGKSFFNFIQAIRSLNGEWIKTSGLEFLRRGMTTLKILFNPAIEGFSALQEKVTAFWTKLSGMSWDEIKVAVTSKIVSIANNIQETFSKIKAAVAGKTFTEILSIAYGKLTATFGSLKEKLIEISPTFGIVYDAAAEKIGKVKETIKDIAVAITGMPWEDLKVAVGTKLNSAFESLRNTLRPFGEIFNTIGTSISNYLLSHSEEIGTFFTNVLEKASSALTKVEEFAQTLPEKFQTMMDAIAKFLSDVGENFDLKEKFREAAGESGNIVTAFVDLVDSIIEAIKSRLSEFNIVDAISEMFSSAEVSPQLASVGDSIMTPFNNFTEGVHKVADDIKNSTFAESIGWMGEQLSKLYNIDVDKVLEVSKTVGKIALLFSAKSVLTNTSRYIKQGKSGLGAITNSIVDMFKGLTTGFGGTLGEVKNVIQGVRTAIDSLGGVFVAEANLKNANAFSTKIKALAISVGVLVAALWVLSTIPQEDLTKGVAALGVALAEFFGILLAFEGLSQYAGIGSNIKGIGQGMLMLVGAILGVMAVIKVLNGVDPTKYAKGILGLIGLIGVLKLLGKAMDGVTLSASTGAGLLAIAIGLRVLVGAVKALGSLKFETLIKGLIGVAGAMIAFGTAARIAGADNGALKMGGGMLMFATALLLLIPTIRMIANMSDAEVERAILAMGSLMAFTAVVSRATKNVKFGALAGMSVAIFAIVIAIRMLAKVEAEDAMRAAVMIGGVFTALGYAMNAMSKMSWSSFGASALTLLAGLASVAALFAFISTDFVNAEKVEQMIKPIVSIMRAMSMMMVASKFSHGDPGISMLKMLGIITAVAAVIGALKTLLPEDIYNTGKDTILKGLEEIGDVVEGIGKLVGRFVGGMFSGSSKGLVEFTNEFKNVDLNALSKAIETVAGIDTMIAGDGGFWEGVGKNLNRWGFGNSMSSVAEGLKDFAKDGQRLDDLSDSAITKAISIIEKLVAFDGKLPDVNGLEWIFAGQDLNWAGFENSISGMGSALAAFASEIVKFDGNEDTAALTDTHIDKANRMLTMFTDIQGTGNVPETSFLDYFAFKTNPNWSGFATSIAGMGAALGSFATEISAFDDGNGGGLLTQNDIDKANNMLTMFTDIQGSGNVPKTGFWEYAWTNGKNMNWDSFKTTITGMGSALRIFALEIQDFKEGEGVIVEDGDIKIADDMMRLFTDIEGTGKVPKTGFWEYMSTGGKNMNWDAFGTSIKGMGLALSNFAAEIKTFSDADDSGAKVDGTDIETAKTMVEMLTSWDADIPKTGGLEYMFSHGNNMNWSAFSKGISGMGAALKTFYTETQGFGENVSVQDMRVAKGMVKMLQSLDVTMPGNGEGLLGALVSDMVWDNFATNVGKLGQGLASFASAGINQTVADTSIDMIKKLAQIKVPESNIWADLLVGNQYDNFALNVGALADGIVSFGTKITEVKPNDLTEGVTHVTSLMTAIETIGTKMPDGFANMASSFKSGLSEIGQALIDIVASIEDMDGEKVAALPSMIQGITESFNLMSAMQSVDTTNLPDISMFTTFLNDLAGQSDQFLSAGNTMVSKVQEGVGQSIASADFTGKGTEIATQFIQGISANMDNIRTQGVGMGLNVVSGVNSEYSSVYDSGAYLMEGLAAGIASRQSAVIAAAVAVASATVSAINTEVAVASPSKKMIATGEFMDDGLAIGLTDNAYKVERGGRKMASSTLDVIRSTLSRIPDIISSDGDLVPTITPVVDLSEIQNGADSINGMLGGSIGYAMNSLGAINRNMNNQRIQATNDDVVNAIRGLRKDIGGLSTNQYNINGITYDDGSNVSDAVNALIRATRMERRRI